MRSKGEASLAEERGTSDGESQNLKELSLKKLSLKKLPLLQPSLKNL